MVKEWCDLSDTYFVLFGATSAMGPFFKLMDLGANVVLFELNRPHFSWQQCNSHKDGMNRNAEECYVHETSTCEFGNYFKQKSATQSDYSTSDNLWIIVEKNGKGMSYTEIFEK